MKRNFNHLTIIHVMFIQIVFTETVVGSYDLFIYFTCNKDTSIHTFVKFDTLFGDKNVPYRRLFF